MVHFSDGWVTRGQCSLAIKLWKCLTQASEGSVRFGFLTLSLVLLFLGALSLPMSYFTAISTPILVNIFSFGVYPGIPFCGTLVKSPSSGFPSVASTGLEFTSTSLVPLSLPLISSPGLASSMASPSSSVGIDLGLVGLLLEIQLIQGLSNFVEMLADIQLTLTGNG